MKIIRKILLCFLAFCSLLVCTGLGYYFFVTRSIELSPEKLLLNEQNILLYDQNGNTVQSASTGFVKETVSIKDVPQALKDAFVATEDKRFYHHHGYDFKRVLRASANNLKARSFKEGASTISQQLIKNTHLSQEKTFKRKLQEWKLTKTLERLYSKDEILERYLNSIYFGHSCFGVTSAAKFYFGKSPTELTLDECAILAGLVKSPNNYSPFKHPESCQKRKATVLRAMQQNGFISESAKKEALQAPLPLAKDSKHDNGYFHFVFDELSNLTEKYHFTIGGKIEIHTFLDQEAQKNLEKIAQTHMASDKTFLILDRELNGFKACVSTVGNIPRLPGSIIKPLLVYAPALEEDIISPATPILDAKINYNGYTPENYGGAYHGYVSARECVEKSLNVPAVKTLDALTVKKGVEYLEKLGLPVDEEDRTLALALGGMKQGFTLKDLLSAYSTLSNEGVYQTGGFISSILINGTTVYKKPQIQKRVFNSSSAYLMTDILKSTVENGTAKKLRSLPFDIAAKTGTVGTDSGNTDAYTVSYTSKDCVGVWLGNADNSKVDYTGGGLACQLAYEINRSLYEVYQKQQLSIPKFQKDKNVCFIELDKQAYYDTHTLMLADENAPQSCRFLELFKTSAIPLNKSTSFTFPTINSPSISLIDNKVCIAFDKSFSTYYSYKIERYDYVTHTTLYEGKYLPVFYDGTVEINKTYVYTVTPIYNGRAGKSITLPTLSTRKGEQAEINHEILSKEWWEY